MVGAGSHVFAVWGYCIANADPERHTVNLNPRLLSTIIGDTVERVESAISFLCSPDPKSHCQDHGGARLIPTTGFEYHLVTHEQYRDVKNNEDLRAYFREAQRKHRMSKTVKDSQRMSSFPASASESVSASGEEGVGEGVDDGWTMEYCVKIAADLNIPKKEAEAFFAHYAPVDFVDGAGRQIVNLEFALQKWHNRQVQEQPKAKQLTPKVRAFLAEKEYDNALADCVDSLLHTDDMSRCLKVLWDKYKNTPVKEGKHVVNRAKEIADFRQEVAANQESPR